MSQTTETKLVKFDGDTIEVLGTCPADAEVSIRHVCKALGVSYQGQVAKLKGKKWATLKENLRVAEDGKQRAQTMIALKSLPMWLTGIEPRKVKEDVREKLERYQQDAHDVLAAAFLDAETGLPSALLAAVSAVVRKAMEPGVGRHEHLQQQIDRLNATLPQAGSVLMRQPVHATPQATVQDRLRHLGWPEASAKQRERVRRRANAWLMLRFGETPDVSGGPGGGGPCVYYGHQITVLDEAVRLVRAEAIAREEARERVSGPTLFSGAAG